MSRKPKTHAASPAAPGGAPKSLESSPPLCGGLVQPWHTKTYRQREVTCRGCLSKMRLRPQLLGAMDAALQLTFEDAETKPDLDAPRVTRPPRCHP